MAQSVYLDKDKKLLWSKLDPKKSIFIKTSNVNLPELEHPETNKSLDSKALKADFISSSLKSTVKKFVQKIKEDKDPEKVTYLIVNKKKVVMQKIYYNIAKLLSPYTNLKVLCLDDIKGGMFTNPQSKKFLEPSNVVVILTRNHNKKELNVIKELEKMHIPSFVLTLNVAFSCDHGFTINLSSIKTLYLFLYALTCYKKKIPYSEFVKDYVFEEKELSFEIFNK